MTDHQNVLHAILADPTDDLSRSAYADILEESGGDPEYVEFIRTQLEAEAAEREIIHCPVGRDSVDGHEVRELSARIFRLHARAKELLERNRKAWCAGIDGLTLDAWSLNQPILSYVYGMRCKFTRGFASLVVSSLKMWGKYGPQVVARHPVEILVIHDREPHVVSGQNRHSLSILRGRAGWYRVSQDSSYCIPTRVWDRLEGYAAKDAVWKCYNTEESAVYALGLAMLNLAREKADLPHLPWNPPHKM